MRHKGHRPIRLLPRVPFKQTTQSRQSHFLVVQRMTLDDVYHLNGYHQAPDSPLHQISQDWSPR
jgi:hypothetical protein